MASADEMVRGGRPRSGRELSEMELRSLFAAYRRDADPAARERIIESFAPLVESVARQHMRRGEPLEDLVQEGFIGLIKAVEMYDPRRGVKFITYATHLIHGEIRHYLRDRTGIIREPGWLHELNGRIVRAVEELTQVQGHYPTVAEIAEHIHVEERAVQEVLRTRPTFRVGSTDIPDDGNDDSFSIDTSKIKSQQPVPFELPIEERIVLSAAMDRLRQLERQVVECFFFQDLSQTEIAKQLNISGNYVSHLIRSSVAKLRNTLLKQEHKEASLRVRAALERRRAYLEARQGIGVRDAVTGLYAESLLEEHLQSELHRSSRYGHELGLVLLEVEGFQKIASSRGAAAANQGLKQVADILESGVRKVDVVTRFGPAGFALILPHTGGPTEKVAQRLVQAVHRERIGATTPRGRGLTLRGGLAVYPLDGLTCDALLTAARAAVARAGGEGSRKVLRAGSQTTEPEPVEAADVEEPEEYDEAEEITEA